MTSLAVESNYSNMTAARGRRRMIIRNPDNTTTITHTTETPYTTTAVNTANNLVYNPNGYQSPNNYNNTVNNNYGNNVSTFNSNLNKSTNSNLGGSNNSLNNSGYNNSPKMNTSANLVYNLKTGDGAGNANEQSPSAMSASLALLNRIKSLENQKKRTNQITSTAIKVAAAAANSAAISSGQIYANPPSNVNNQNMNNSYRLANSAQKHSQNGLTVYEQIEANRSPSPMQSPSQNRRNVGKFERQGSFSKSQEELTKLRMSQSKSANPNVYKDKISDQKFFSRNFKVQMKPSSANSQNTLDQQHANIMRYLNESPDDSDVYLNRSNNNNNINNSINSTNGVVKNEKDLTQLNVSLSNQSPAVSQNNMHLVAINSAATQNSHGSSSLNNGANSSNNTTTTNNNNTNSSNYAMNKLKLLKKRNALKKSASNARDNNGGVMSNERTVTITGGASAGPASNSRSQVRLEQMSMSKEELHKSQASFTNLVNANNLSNKNISKHLSRHSLNNGMDSYNGSTNHLNQSYSNPQLHYRSNETGLDEITFADLKSKELRQSRLSFRAQSNKSNLNNSVNNNLNANQKAKSENELAYEEHHTSNCYELPAIDNSQNVKHEDRNGELLVTEAIETREQLQYSSSPAAKFEKQITKSAKAELNNSYNRENNKAIIANSNYLNSRVKSTNVPIAGASNQHVSLQNYNKSQLLPKRDKSNESSKISNYRGQDPRNEETTYEPMAGKSSDFRIVFPNGNGNVSCEAAATNANARPMKLYDEPNLDYIDPNNIMSDPVIMEQFRKLYEEDEYFQQVHRKCCEWLLRYVIPEMEAARAAKTTGNNSNHENY